MEGETRVEMDSVHATDFTLHTAVLETYTFILCDQLEKRKEMPTREQKGRRITQNRITQNEKTQKHF
jgi:hypothetical protein